MVLVELVVQIIAWIIGIIIGVIVLIFQGIFALFRAGARAAEEAAQERARQARATQQAAETAARQAQMEREAAERERQYREQQRRQEEERQRALRMREVDREQRQKLVQMANQGGEVVLARSVPDPVQWTDNSEELTKFSYNLSGSIGVTQGSSPPSKLTLQVQLRSQGGDALLQPCQSSNDEYRLIFNTQASDQGVVLSVAAGVPFPDKIYEMDFVIGGRLSDEFEYGRYVTRYEVKAVPLLVSREYMQGISVKADLWYVLSVPVSLVQ